MATTRIKDISSTVTSLASDDYVAVDGATNGTRKMVRNSIYTDVASAFTGAPTTYDICPLNSGTGKIDATYLPTSGDTPKGEWNASTNSPSLTDGTGTAGDYYDVTTAGTQNLGSGSITFAVGDVVKYNGSTWFKIDSVANILDGSATAADGRSALSVNSKDEDAEATGTKLVGPALYFRGAGPNDHLEVADDSKLTFSSSAEFGTNSSGTWSPDDNSPALTDGTGTLNQHYRVDSGAGTVTQGGSTLSIINGTATTAGQAVYYDGSVWRLKDVDDLPFSISAWIKILDADGCRIVGKYAASNTHREYNFGTAPITGKLRLQLRDGSGYSPTLNSTSSMSSYAGQWVHVACTYAGSGPNSTNPFSAAMSSGSKLYINGALDPTAVASDFASYAGMSNTPQALTIGLSDNEYGNVEIRNVKIFNRELTATEVAQLARGTDLGFADEWGDHTTNIITDGDMETAGTANWVAVTTTLSKETASPHGGSQNLKVILNGATSGYVQTAATPMSAGKRYRAKFWYRTGGTAPNAYRFRGNGSSWQEILTLAANASWTYHEVEFVAQSDTNGRAVFYIELGTDADTYIEIDDFEVVAIGTLADFRAENFDSDTGKLYDLSDNSFVGTNNGATLTGRAYPVYETGTWTPSVTFGGGSTGVTYSQQEGNYTRIGQIVYVSGYFVLTSKGTDTGSALIEGLPYSSVNLGAQTESMTVNRTANMAGLTSVITGNINDNATTAALYDHGATGSVALDDANFTNTTSIRFSGWYQIQ